MENPGHFSVEINNHIKAKFEDALRDTDLDPSSRPVVERAFVSVKEGHDKMSALKHSMA